MPKKHRDEVLRLLRTQIACQEEVDQISGTAEEVACRWVNPLAGGAAEQTNGLIYGLVQSGKTGVLTVSGALGADEGYRTILVLTSDINPLYDQTLGRLQEGFPGIDILGKADLKDQDSFLQRLKSGICAIVITKNGKVLGDVIQNLKVGRVPGLTCLIIDDEADQASLNTRASKADGSRSVINDRIAELRGFFQKSTHLQVTATPQALFLQPPGHDFRPRFTVLSHPGAGYVGGEDFFGEGSNLVREFDLNDIAALDAGAQPRPGQEIPQSLLRALDTFMIAATVKRLKEADQNSAFLCHVSTRTADHHHIVRLLRKYKTDLAAGARRRTPSIVGRLGAQHRDLSESDDRVRSTDLDDLVEAIGFYSPGINVKMVNGQTDEDVAVRSPYNLFVGGNKLGRGVTIKNLLVSYYGRNPKAPQADTVLQHARMYGYRRPDIGLLRLFLPRELHTVFKAIHKMETGLRELIARNPGEEFRGVYLERGLNPTRSNVLAPGSLGVYSGGGVYNPAQVLRDASIASHTERIDDLLRNQPDKAYRELSIEEMRALIASTRPDFSASERVWDPLAVAESLTQYASLSGQNSGYVYVDRDRGLKERRRETQGILDGGETRTVPQDKITLFLLRIRPESGSHAAWWPQIRFPAGRYAFAFAV